MLDTSSRLLRLLSILQGRRFWTGPELAARLEVTPRTLRRDVDRLRSLGYGVEATSGPGGGYQLGKGTSLPPLLLDDDEAVAVAVALRSAVDSFARLGETVMSVLVKIEQLLPARLRRRVGALQAVTVSLRSGPTEAPDPDVLTTLATACRDEVCVIFGYRSKEGIASTRHVEPLRIVHAGGGRWYLAAFDLDRNAWRTFRVDRVTDRPALGSGFVPREPPGDVATYVSDAISHVGYPIRATVRLPGSATEVMTRLPWWIGVVKPGDDGHCVLHTGAETIEGLVCHLALVGTDFEVIEPTGLAPRMGTVVERLARGCGR